MKLNIKKYFAIKSIPLVGKIKIGLLFFAFIITALILFYTHNLVQLLSVKEKEWANLYAKSLKYVVSGNTENSDYSFIFPEFINTIDFPVIITDKNNEPIYPYKSAIKNIFLDTTQSVGLQRNQLKNIIENLDRYNEPIKVVYQDTVILNYLHYGESAIIVQLRLLPYIEISVAILFILIAYISFSYVKRSEEGYIWIGMARETAHQLGTPISSMHGWIELLKNYSKDDNKTKTTLHDMESDINRLQKIADRFAKIGAPPDLHEANIVDIINGVIEYFQKRLPQYGKTVQLILESEKSIRTKINRELFEWVIENLTKNALDAIENNEGTILYSIGKQGNYIYIDISDTGKGINIKNKNDVFRPGFSTKRRGWGLGLSLAKRVIETHHNGKLFLVDSKIGYSTTFRIKLKK